MNGNYNLVYPKLSDYYDINVTNENFSKLADAIDTVKSGGLKKEVVVASYNTKNPYKAVADYVCSKDNAVSALTSAVAACSDGGMLVLLDGDYYINSVITIDKAITIVGYGAKTRLIQGDLFTDYCMLKVKASNTTIKDIAFQDTTNAYVGTYYIAVESSDLKISGCDFTMNRTNINNEFGAVLCSAYKCRILMLGCYMRKHNDVTNMIYSGDCILAGVVMGNYCENIDTDSELPVRIYVKSSDLAEKIKLGAQNTLITLNAEDM